MMLPRKYNPVILNEDEQVVLAVNGRAIPTLIDFVLIVATALALFLAPILILHHLFRPVTYFVTTTRVLIVEPECVVGEMPLSEIKRFKGTRKALMIYGRSGRLWLHRMRDAWQFETVINNVRRMDGGLD